MSFGMKMAILWVFFISLTGGIVIFAVFPPASRIESNAALWRDEHLGALEMATKGRALERSFMAAAREMRDLGLDGRPVDSPTVNKLLSSLEENREKFKLEVKDIPASRLGRTFTRLSEKLAVFETLARVVAANPGLAEERGKLRALEPSIDEDLAELNSMVNGDFRLHTIEGPPEDFKDLFSILFLCFALPTLGSAVGTSLVYQFTRRHCQDEFQKMMDEEMENTPRQNRRPLPGKSGRGQDDFFNDDDFDF